MGLESRGTVRHGRRKAAGRIQLETAKLIFRGEFELVIPIRDMRSVSARAGRLEITWQDGVATFELGDAAERWAHKILHPPSRIDKLGVKPGQRVSIVGVDDTALSDEIRARTESVHAGRIAAGSDIVLLGARRRADLDRIARAAAVMPRNGSVWVVWPKGRRELNEDHVRAAAIAAGLVDVKVVSVSDTLSGLKLVIPVANR